MKEIEIASMVAEGIRKNDLANRLETRRCPECDADMLMVKLGVLSQEAKDRFKEQKEDSGKPLFGFIVFPPDYDYTYRCLYCLKLYKIIPKKPEYLEEVK